MITEDKINLLYETIISNKELTTSMLNDCGFNSNDIKILVDNYFMDRIKRGYYQITDVSSLYSYGEYLLENKEYEKAGICFKKCFLIDPNYKACAFQSFLDSIRNKELDKSLKYFRVVMDTDNEFYIQDNNLYLYILNQLIELPEDLKEIASSIDYSDVEVSELDKRYCDTYMQNKLRNSILHNNYNLAIKTLNGIIRKYGEHTVQEVLIRRLCNIGKEKQNSEKKYLIENINNKNYDEILNYLNKKDKLKNIELVIIKLINIIKEIKETDLIPRKTILDTNDYISAIDGNNYSLALKLVKEYNERYKIKDLDSPILILLTEINNLIDEKRMVGIPTEKDILDKYNLLIDNLNNNDVTKFSEILCEYLEISNNKKYEKLLVNIFKIDQVNNYEKLLYVLDMIHNNKFSMKRKPFINSFYKCIENDDIEEAFIYLEIVGALEDIKEEHQFYKRLYKLYKMKSNSVNEYKKSNYIENWLIEKNMKKLKKAGSIILNPMEEEKRLKVHNVVKEFDDIISFTIGKGKKRRIVLNYTPKLGEGFDNLYMEAEEAYKKHRTKEAINLYKEIIARGGSEAFVYVKLALCYLRQGKKKTALTYLEIASELSLKYNGNNNYVVLLDYIKGLCDNDEFKNYTKIKEEEFNEYNNYGIDNLSNILYLIYEERKSLEEACNLYSLSEEEINIVKLICAKEEYINSNTYLGDLYLKQVEKSKNKNEIVKELFSELVRNRKLYKNKPNTNSVVKLILSNKTK